MLDEQVAYVRTLPEHIRDSIRVYTGGAGYTINARLRERPWEGIEEQYQQTIEHLDQAFAGVPNIDRPLQLYRSIDKYFAVNYKSQGFVSASLKKSEALSNTSDIDSKLCCVLEITVPAGAKVLPVAEISEHPDEQEVLLPRNGTLQFISETTSRVEGEIFIWMYFQYIPPDIGAPSRLDQILDKTRDQVAKIQYLLSDDTLHTFAEETQELDGEYDEYVAEVRLYIGSLCERVGCLDGVAEMVLQSIDLGSFWSES